MPETLKDKTAVVGIGATPYYKRGESLPQTELELACKAILAALDDAGLTVKDLDGFTIYSSSRDPAQVASVLGVPEVRFAASLTSGGGGSAGSLGLAASAIVSGQAEVCVTLMTLQQAKRRLGGSAVGGWWCGIRRWREPLRRRWSAQLRRLYRRCGHDGSRTQLRPVDQASHGALRD